MLTDEQIKALRDGCEGVTPGPWDATSEIAADVDHYAHSIYGEGYKGLLIARCNQNGSHDPDAAHIARCDPDTIRELCTRVLEAEARVKVLEDALRPFSDCIDENGWLTVRRVTHDEARAARKALEAGKC